MVLRPWLRRMSCECGSLLLIASRRLYVEPSSILLILVAQYDSICCEAIWLFLRLASTLNHGSGTYGWSCAWRQGVGMLRSAYDSATNRHNSERPKAATCSIIRSAVLPTFWYWLYDEWWGTNTIEPPAQPMKLYEVLSSVWWSTIKGFAGS